MKSGTAHLAMLQRLLAGVAALGMAAPLTAQEAGEPEAEGIEEVVVVTGTYIKGSPEDAALPITTLNRDDLQLEGQPTAIDLVKSMSFSQGADGETDQFQAGAGADRATVNIRGLGPSRTLVLVNGRRTTWSPHAIGAQAQLLVDVNMIPNVAVERVEVLRDGAAATYGSDAIAGVVNFITRGNFEGLEVSASHKAIQDSDGDQEYSAIWGGSFMDDRAHLVSSFGYATRNRLRIADRDWSLRPFSESTRGGWSSVGRPAVVVPLDVWNGPLGQGVLASAGGFAALLATGIVDPNCEDLGGARTSVGVAGNSLGGFCRFQYTAFDNLIEEQERWQWFSEGSVDLSDTTSLSIELLIGNTDVPDWGTSPSYPPNRLVDETRTVRANNPGLIDMASKYPDLYSAYASCAQDYCGYEGGPWDEVAWFYGRYYGQDGPPRGHKRESDLWRFAAALDGDWQTGGGAGGGWQLSVSYSGSERVSAGGDTMAYRDERARNGLGGFECEATVPNEYDADGNLEFSLATLERWAGQGPCQYWIPFSNSMPGAHPLVLNGEAVNPDFNPALSNQPLRDYIVTADEFRGETSLLVVEGILSGQFGSIADSPIDYVVGLQYRDETYESGVSDDSFYNGVRYPCIAGPEITDCTMGRTGLFNFLPPSFGIDEDRAIWALFSEFQFTLTDRLDSQLSVRYEDYGGETGSTVDPKLAFRWQVTDSIGLRASFGSTFRGPTLNQTVGSNSSNSLQFVGVTGAFKRVDTNGNPGLKPEEANTINLGLLVDHDGLLTSSDNLFVTVDYWSYDFTDPLVTEPHNGLVAIACPGGICSGPFSERLVFGSESNRATDIEIININIVNGPDYQTDGIDFTFRYGLEVGPGYLSAAVTGTNILSYDIDSWAFGDEYDALGRLNYRTSLARTLAELKGRFTFNYSWQSLNLRWVAAYIDSYDYLGAAPQPAGDAEVDAHLTHDLHVAYTLLDERLTLVGSVINVQDEDPPWMSREFNYDAFTHNPFGRMVRVAATLSIGGR